MFLTCLWVFNQTNTSVAHQTEISMAATLTKQQLLSLVSLMEKKLCETCPDFDIAEYIHTVTAGDLQEVGLADYGLLPDLTWPK